MGKILDNEEMAVARDAVRILYNLGLINIFVYEGLLAQIERNTGA